MFYYIDNDNNLVKSTVALNSSILRPLTEEEYTKLLTERMEV